MKRNWIITYEWYSKKFTSQIRLFELSRVGAIKLEQVQRNQYGDDFNYYSLDGQFIASYYKDNGWGHGSQATGIELKHHIPVISQLPECAECTRYGDIRRKAA